MSILTCGVWSRDARTVRDGKAKVFINVVVQQARNMVEIVVEPLKVRSGTRTVGWRDVSRHLEIQELARGRPGGDEVLHVRLVHP